MKAFNTIATTFPNGGCLKVSMWVQEDGVRKNHILGSINPTKKQTDTKHKSKLHQIISRCSIRYKNDCSFQLKHMLSEKPSAPKSYEALGQLGAEVFMPGFTFYVLCLLTHQLLKSQAVRRLSWSHVMSEEWESSLSMHSGTMSGFAPSLLSTSLAAPIPPYTFLGLIFRWVVDHYTFIQSFSHSLIHSSVNTIKGDSNTETGRGH